MAAPPPWLEEWFRSHGYPVPDDIPTGSETQYTTGSGGTSAPSGGTDSGTDIPGQVVPGQPPYGTYDPALEAERRAQERGLEDILLDTKRQRHRAGRDYQQQMHDLQTSKKRGLGDIKRERKRGTQTIKQKTEDVQTSAARGREDFGARLGSLIHNYQVLAGNQLQQANSRGVLAGSTLQAGAAARAGNFARARQPLDTGLARVNEDEARSIGRLGLAQTQLTSDTQRAAHQLRQDVHHDTRLAGRDLHRTIQDIHTQRQRAIREQRIGSADTLEQEAYQAHELHPGTVPAPTGPPPPVPTGGGGGGGHGHGHGGGGGNQGGGGGNQGGGGNTGGTPASKIKKRVNKVWY